MATCINHFGKILNSISMKGGFVARFPPFYPLFAHLRKQDPQSQLHSSNNSTVENPCGNAPRVKALELRAICSRTLRAMEEGGIAYACRYVVTKGRTDTVLGFVSVRPVLSKWYQYLRI